MSANTSTTRDRALTTINVVVWAFMIAAAALSSSHIVESGMRLGLDWEAWTLPLFVDGIAVVGKVSMLPRFSPTFRKSGFRLLMLGGVLSLAANVYAGHNLGQRLFGILVVAGFMALESHATKASRSVAIAPAPEPEPEEEAPKKKTYTKVSDEEKAARKRAMYDAMNPAERARWTTAYRAKQARKAAATNPVSPGAWTTTPAEDEVMAEIAR